MNGGIWIDARTFLGLSEYFLHAPIAVLSPVLSFKHPFYGAEHCDVLLQLLPHFGREDGLLLPDKDTLSSTVTNEFPTPLGEG